MKKLLETKGETSKTDFDETNDMLKLWLDVVKKMEFYRLDGEFRQLTFSSIGLYQLFKYGNLRSVYLLSEIEKYRSCDEGITISEMKLE